MGDVIMTYLTEKTKTVLLGTTLIMLIAWPFIGLAMCLS